jgi:hypothetical protein
MTPLFTVHAGEYLVGAYIERHFRNRPSQTRRPGVSLKLESNPTEPSSGKREGPNEYSANPACAA